MNSTIGTSTIDLGPLFEQGRWSGFQKFVVAITALAFATDGIANQTLGLALPALVKAWGVPKHALASVAALGLIGIAVGTALGGVIGDRIGRRPSLIGSLFLFGIATAATAFTDTIGGLSALRFIAGLGLGGAIPNGAALVAEYTPVRRRSLGISLSMLFIPIGGVLVGIIASYVLPRFGWQALFLISGALPVLAALLFVLLLPESPRFLVRDPARRAELIKILARAGHEHRPDAIYIDSGSGQQSKTAITALLGPGMRRVTLALWCGFFLCFLANYTLISWGPVMVGTLGFDLAATSSALSAYNFGGIVGGLAAGAAIVVYGYRRILLLVAAGSFLCTAALGFAPAIVHQALLIIFSLALVGFFIGGLQNGLYALASHIYPSYVRATGVGAAASTGRLGAVASSFTGVMTLESGGSTGFFGFIACAMLAMIVCVLLLGADRSAG